MSMQKELNRGTLIGAPTRPKQLAQEIGAATALPLRRTGSSNPLPSSGESGELPYPAAGSSRSPSLAPNAVSEILLLAHRA
jgi:hypothetical protein